MHGGPRKSYSTSLPVRSSPDSCVVASLRQIGLLSGGGVALVPVSLLGRWLRELRPPEDLGDRNKFQGEIPGHGLRECVCASKRTPLSSPSKRKVYSFLITASRLLLCFCFSPRSTCSKSRRNFTAFRTARITGKGNCRQRSDADRRTGSRCCDYLTTATPFSPKSPNGPEVPREFEIRAPQLETRLLAAPRAREMGYATRMCLDPIVRVPGRPCSRARHIVAMWANWARRWLQNRCSGLLQKTGPHSPVHDFPIVQSPGGDRLLWSAA